MPATVDDQLHAVVVPVLELEDDRTDDVIHRGKPSQHGEILKDDFRLKALLDAPRTAVVASKDYLLSKFGEPDAGWLPA